MLRNLILLGAAAGAAVAVPAIYEANPALFHAMLRRQAETPAHIPATFPTTAPSEPHAEVLPGRRVRLAADPRGHFSAEFKLNGRRVEALVDTGATLVAINRSTARRIGVHLVPTDFVYEVNTANGKAKAAAATIDTLAIGRIHLQNVEAMVLEDRALKGALIGMSFLKRLDRFAIEEGALLLEQ